MRLAGGVSLIVLAQVLATAAWADAYSGSHEPVLLQADRVTYDRTGKKVNADGHVEAAQGKRVLIADHLDYDQDSGKVTATGNVSLLDDSGNVLFAEEMTLDKDMSEGIATSARFLMTDNSRAAGVFARRSEGRSVTLDKAIYSSCNLCKDDPSKPPLWDLKAARIIHDDVNQTVVYEDAQLEFFGIPVFYSPYFSHPDPGVSRQSGFLIPGMSNSSDLGARITIPYYYVISDWEDAVVAPTYTSLAGVGLWGDYRHRFTNAVMELQGSFIDSHNTNFESAGVPELRGHLFGYGRMDLDEDWKVGFDLQRASDSTYLRRFNITNATLLTSSLFAERITAHDSLTIDSYAFQNVLPTSLVPGSTVPYVAPLVNYQHTGDPGWLGSRFDWSANGLDLVRPEGRDVRRLAGEGSWSLPFTTDLGEIYKIAMTLDTEGYWFVGSNRIPAPTDRPDRLSDRIWPTVSVDWRWPFVRDENGWRQVVEPIVQLVASPYGGNKGIPNEDSTTIEFDDTNLFSTSRYAGLDRVESGPRANVGGQWSLYAPSGSQISVLFGDILRPKEDRYLNAILPGLGDKNSDYISRVTIKPSDWLDVTARFRLDRENWKPHETQIQAQIGPGDFRIGVGYLDTPPDPTDPTIIELRQLSMSVYYKFLPNYYVTAVGTRDLLSNKWVTYTTGLWYTDECFDGGLTLQRTNVTSGELRSSTSVGFVLRLKSLGTTFLLPGFTTPFP